MKQYFLICLCLLSGAVSAQTSYRIGDTGPAGGFIFFDKGNAADGWRYLEAAPGDFRVQAEWGTMGVMIEETGIDIGYGKQNTRLIVMFAGQYGEQERAAQLCDSLSFNGADDWFLPSISELGLMYQNLVNVANTGFRQDWYWSSSQYGVYGAYGQHFGDGSQYANLAKTNVYYVRAIRAF
jgi:hypothetical protein